MARLELIKYIEAKGCNKMCHISPYKELLIYGLDSPQLKKANDRGYTHKQFEKMDEIFNNCYTYKCRSHRTEIRTPSGGWTDKFLYIRQKWHKFEWKRRVFLHQCDKEEKK